MAKSQQELHNELAPKFVSDLVHSVLDNGGESSSLCVVTESILVGVLLVVDKLGIPKAHALDLIYQGALERLEKMK